MTNAHAPKACFYRTLPFLETLTQRSNILFFLFFATHKKKKGSRFFLLFPFFRETGYVDMDTCISILGFDCLVGELINGDNAFCYDCKEGYEWDELSMECILIGGGAREMCQCQAIEGIPTDSLWEYWCTGYQEYDCRFLTWCDWYGPC